MKKIRVRYKILILTSIILFIAVNAFHFIVKKLDNAFGGNIGDIVQTKDSLKYRYIEQYIDSFYTYYPEYIVPDSIAKRYDYKSHDYEHLSMFKFYFNKKPVEIYFIGNMMNVVFVYDPINKTWISNTRAKPLEIDDKEIERIKHRFEKEINPKLELVLLKYVPAEKLYVEPF